MPGSLATIRLGLHTICCNSPHKSPTPTATQSPTAVRKAPKIVLRALLQPAKTQTAAEVSAPVFIVPHCRFLYCDFSPRIFALNFEIKANHAFSDSRPSYAFSRFRTL